VSWLGHSDDILDDAVAEHLELANDLLPVRDHEALCKMEDDE